MDQGGVRKHYCKLIIQQILPVTREFQGCRCSRSLFDARALPLSAFPGVTDSSSIMSYIAMSLRLSAAPLGCAPREPSDGAPSPPSSAPPPPAARPLRFYAAMEILHSGRAHRARRQNRTPGGTHTHRPCTASLVTPPNVGKSQSSAGTREQWPHEKRVVSWGRQSSRRTP